MSEGERRHPRVYTLSLTRAFGATLAAFEAHIVNSLLDFCYGTNCSNSMVLEYGTKILVLYICKPSTEGLYRLFKHTEYATYGNQFLYRYRLRSPGFDDKVGMISTSTSATSTAKLSNHAVRRYTLVVPTPLPKKRNSPSANPLRLHGMIL